MHSIIQGLGRVKLRAIVSLVFLILIWIEFSLNVHLNLWVVLLPLVFFFFILAYLSPPVSVALLFMAHALLAYIGSFYPGVFVQAILAIVVIFSASYSRWKQGCFFNFSQRKKSLITLAVIIIVLSWGFINALILHGVSLNDFVIQFVSTQGANYSVWHIVFVTRWAGLMLLGILAVENIDDLKLFLIAFSFLFVAQILSIPSENYVNFFFFINQHTALSFQSSLINRSHFGFIAAISSLVALGAASRANLSTMALIVFSAWFGITGLLVILAGSKGPLLAWAIGILIVMQLVGKYNLKKSVVLLSMPYILLILLSLISNIVQSTKGEIHLIPSAVNTQYSSYAHSSFKERWILYLQAKQTYSSYGNWNDWLFGRGLGSCVLQSFDKGINGNFIYKGSGSHNLFIDFLLDVGLVGLILLSVSFFFLVFKVINLFKNKNGMTEAIWLRVLISIMIVILCFSLFSTAPHVATLFILFLGVFIGVEKVSENKVVVS